MQTDLHPIQAKILLVLLFQPTARFTQLNRDRISSDHFTFHINQLVSLDLISKTESGYELTAHGKEVANQLDTDTIVFEKQAKVGVLVVCVKTIKGTQMLLMQKRLKQPYYGYHGFITGKIKWGETIYETAARELQEEAGLIAEVFLTGIKHKMDYSQEGKLLEDKFFYVFRAENSKGRFTEEFKGGKNLWIQIKDIKKLPNLFDGIKESIDMITKDILSFSEKKYVTHNY